MIESIKDKFFDLLIKQGVYSRLKSIDGSVYQALTKKEIFKSIDLYCPFCKNNKTFLYVSTVFNQDIGYVMCSIENGSGYKFIGKECKIIYKCPTCENVIIFHLLYDDSKMSLIKIGQYPSLYDISNDELKQYQKSSLISDDDIKQLYKAYTCASESYFVAAYTYMRRVFENLLSAAFNDNKGEIGLTEEEFRKLRSNEKLEKLKDYLAIDDEIYAPLYALLSVGIHSLTEEECGENFELLKSILLDILAEQKAKKEKEQKRKQIKTLYSKKEAERKVQNNAKDEK